MAHVSEETTKGLTADALKDIIDYPSNQNIKVDGITWFKEDSYKGTDYDWLSSVFEKARAFTKDLIKTTKLYLPVNEKGEPDYEFMEEYIKSLPFSNKI